MLKIKIFKTPQRPRHDPDGSLIGSTSLLLFVIDVVAAGVVVVVLFVGKTTATLTVSLTINYNLKVAFFCYLLL